MTKCKNCETELTFMEEAKCLRCLSCHPVTKTVPVEKKETNYVDVPWTAERIWEVVEPKIEKMIREELENWFAPKEEELDRVKPRQPDNPAMDWRAKAKAMNIEVYDKARKRPRLKIDVLAEIAERTKGPDTPADNVRQ